MENENIMIFDTETSNLEKPFCYNIGYIIKKPNGETLLKRDYVVEQVWHNNMLFSTSYYADKRPIYISAMRQRKTIMEKFGYICQQMIRDIKAYEIKYAFAYNSGFDERVFNFNCEWFKCNNPFDNVKILDIRGYFHKILANDFKAWADLNEKFTESGAYSTTAETVYQFISGNLEFIEDHTALSDSEIESEILDYCLVKGCKLGVDYIAKKTIPRNIIKDFYVKWNGNIILHEQCESIMYKKKDNTVLLKG